jgi:hypothetical protein
LDIDNFLKRELDYNFYSILREILDLEKEAIERHLLNPDN